MEPDQSTVTLPPWYMSTAGPGISSTLINIVGNILPVVNLVLASHGIQLMPAGINTFISLAVFVFFSGKAAVGYIRAKKILGAQIVHLGGTVFPRKY